MYDNSAYIGYRSSIFTLEIQCYTNSFSTGRQIEGQYHSTPSPGAYEGHDYWGELNW